jgi:hypothetical protein
LSSPKKSIAVIITWTMVLVCLRMMFIVAQPILRFARGRWWLTGALLAVFALAFFYRPAIAYYWFWGSVLFLVGSMLVDSLLPWLRSKL